MQKALRSFLNLVFPTACLSCGAIIPNTDTGLCPACRSRISPIGEFLCSSCGKRVSEGQCTLHAKAIPVFCVFSYHDDVVRAMIHTLKYSGVSGAARAIAKEAKNIMTANPLLERTLRNLPVVFIPVPLHPSKERGRGFNQSALIAGELCRIFGESGAALSVERKILRRHRPTPSQTACGTKEDRRINMAGAFTAADATSLRGKFVMLVDDVTTSGATLEEAARTLRYAGAPHVAGLAIAKA